MRRWLVVVGVCVVVLGLVAVGCAPATPPSGGGGNALVVGQLTPVRLLAGGGVQEWSYTAVAGEVVDLALTGVDASNCPDLVVVDAVGVEVGSVVGCGSASVRFGVAGVTKMGITNFTADRRRLFSQPAWWPWAMSAAARVVTGRPK